MSEPQVEDPIEDLEPFIPPIPPPKCKPYAHPEWRGGIDGYWVCVDDREWTAIEEENGNQSGDRSISGGSNENDDT